MSQSASQQSNSPEEQQKLSTMVQSLLKGGSQNIDRKQLSAVLPKLISNSAKQGGELHAVRIHLVCTEYLQLTCYRIL